MCKSNEGYGNRTELFGSLGSHEYFSTDCTYEDRYYNSENDKKSIKIPDNSGKKERGIIG